MIIDSTWNPGIPGVTVEDVVEVDISVLVEDWTGVTSMTGGGTHVPLSTDS